MKSELYFDIKPKFPGRYPVLPLRDIVVFPYHIVPLFVGRQKSALVVEHALQTDKLVFLTAQRDLRIEDPTAEDIYPVGTVGIILRMMRDKESPDRMKILVQGICKARILGIFQSDPFYIVVLGNRESEKSERSKPETEAFILPVKEKLDKLISEQGATVRADIMVVIENLEDPEKLAHLVTANIGLEVSQAQEILEIGDPIQKLMRTGDILDGLIRQYGDFQ
ncbi:MAG: LON peptidase substrate-binding domain-containing protein [Nitrospirae bacterium]|nr:LON peptidase substrate-binding domain-containing protein [Nitrospirota bacterium]